LVAIEPEENLIKRAEAAAGEARCAAEWCPASPRRSPPRVIITLVIAALALLLALAAVRRRRAS
jgi:MYXO-CTERM domain-containing protein